MKRITIILLASLTSLAMFGQMGASLKGGFIKGSETSASFTHAVGVYLKHNNFQLETDLQYVKTVYIQEPTESGMPSGYEFTNEYLKVPFIVSYKVLNTRIYLSPLLGYGANIRISKSSITYIEQKSYKSSYIAGLKIGFNVSDRIDIELEGRYELQEINSTSVLAGINYKF